MSEVKIAKKVKKRNPLLPAMGFIIAIMLAIVAFFASDVALEYFKSGYLDDPAEFYSRIGANEPGKGDPTPNAELVVRGFFGVVLWLVLFSAAMMVVAVAVGYDPDTDMALAPPSPSASAKEWKKWKKKEKKILERERKMKERYMKEQAQKKRR